MKGFGEKHKPKKKVNKNTNIHKDKIINQAFYFHSQGNIKEAAKYYKYFIDQGYKNYEVFSNYGVILKVFGKLKEAELSYLKAIECDPKHAKAHFNLGTIFSEIGKLKEAELSYLKAIECDPNYIEPYYSLSLLKYSDENKIWKNQLFSQSIFNKKSKEDQINIYFARANVLHREKNFQESSKFLTLANQLKLNLKPSNSPTIIKKSKELLIESTKQEINKIENTKSEESIFIVGMPRSGSTLLESILSINNKICDLGESKILEEAFQDYKKSNQELNLAERYLEKIKDHKLKSNSTTNKNLYNFIYSGIIVQKIPNAKIIHCFRNPLDNILSIYRANFTRGNEYSSSLIDAAKVYLDQEEIMSKYKNRFRSKIYDFNYDLLVRNPNEKIKSLISWLGWKWIDDYLSPHLNKRTVFTASKVQVRSPINSKSLGGWKNYKDMLRPAMEIITQKDKYKDLKY